MQAVATLASLLMLSAHGSASVGQDKNAKEAPPVIVETVIQKSVNSGYRVVGTVKPLRTSTIGVAVGGRVASFLVDVGQPVKRDQVLAELRTGTLEIELAAAKAELVLYEQQLAEVTNGSRPEEIAEAEANLKAAEAAKDNAAKQLGRLEQIQASGAATATDIEDARERANRTRFIFSAAKASYQRVASGSRIEKIAAGQAQVDLQSQRVKLIEDRIRLHTVRAPFDGFVSKEFTEIGAWLTSGDPVVEVIQLETVEIQAPVTAEYAVKLTPGEPVRVEFSQLPDRLFTGTVDRIVPQADPRARTYPIYVRLKNELRQGDLPLLLDGMLARIDLPTGSARTLPLVPKDAVVLANGKRRVFVIEEEVADSSVGIAREITVELGVAWHDLIQVNGALKPGQTVVVVGNERLNEGDRVRIEHRAKE